MSVTANDVYSARKARRVVQITVDGGTVLNGSLVIPKTRSIAELLNGPLPFIEFESNEGERIFIAKPAVRTVRPMDCTKR